MFSMHHPYRFPVKNSRDVFPRTRSSHRVAQRGDRQPIIFVVGTYRVNNHSGIIGDFSHRRAGGVCHDANIIRNRYALPEINSGFLQRPYGQSLAQLFFIQWKPCMRLVPSGETMVCVAQNPLVRTRHIELRANIWQYEAAPKPKNKRCTGRYQRETLPPHRSRCQTQSQSRHQQAKQAGHEI